MPRWQVFCAVVLRRLPELLPKKDPIETRVQQIFNAQEFGMSRYSPHEMQHQEDNEIKENPDSDVLIKETAQDKLDKWIKIKSKFEFAEHVDRLTKAQFLFINSEFRGENQWILPQLTFDRNQGDQDLMDTARRALKESLDIINGFTIISRIPSSHCSYKYPRKIVESVGFDGAKVFYLKANLDRPSKDVLNAINSEKNDKLKWLTRDEAREIVDKTYMKGLEKGLLHEDRVDINRVLNKASKYVESSRALSVKATA